MNNIFTSCDFLRNHIMFKRNGIAFCCNAKHDTFIPLEYWKKPLDADYIIDYRKKVEDSLAAGEPCMCTGCHLLETKAWKRSKYIARQVSFEGTNGCNFRCVYCIYDKNIVAMDNAVEGWIHLVNDMVSRNLIDPNGIILYADGEPLIMKNISHLFEFIHRNTNLRMDIRSNLSVLPNSFVDFFRTGRITLVTSLDCGTRNTFRVIKNNDCFDKVVDHIFCCADANPENLYLKYICIPENISQEDMNGFVEIAERANCRQVIISFDYLKTISDDIYAFAAKLAAQCHRKGVDARFEYFLAEQRCGDQYPKQRIGLHYRNAFSNPFTDFHALARPSSGEIGICHFGPDAPDDLAIHVWCHDPLSSRNAKAVVAFWKDTLLYSGKPNLSMQGGPLRGGGGAKKWSANPPHRS